MKNTLIMILMLMASQVSVAGSCSANVCTAKLTQLFIHENTNVYMKVDAQMGVLDCVIPSGGGIVLRKANPLHSELYSALLSAYMNQSTIRLRAAVRSDAGNNDQECELRYIIMNKAY